jgi:hypothetical protein
MQLSQIAAKPQLIKMILDDEDTIKEFGEPVEFYTWDRQPMDVFMQLASVSNKDPQVMIGIIRTLILDEAGKEIITKDAMLPSSVLLRVVGKVVDLLGK